MNVPLITADQGFSSLARHMSRWIEQVLGSDYAKYHARQAWSPAIDLYEDEASFYLVVDLAGVDPKTVDLHVDQAKDKLLLAGEREAPRPPGKAECPPPGRSLRLQLMEINHGPFLRTLDLPESVQKEQICACYKQGFLWVKMPKKG